MRELDVYLSREDSRLLRVVSNRKFVSVGGKWYEKKSKRILAAALSAILIWNTCEWQPQALAAGSLQRIGAETGADDTAETAEKEAALKKSELKASPSDASPSNAEVKDNRGGAGANGAPNGTATGAETKAEIEAFLELDEAIACRSFLWVPKKAISSFRILWRFG